jgi:hypothetical protein
MVKNMSKSVSLLNEYGAAAHQPTESQQLQRASAPERDSDTSAISNSLLNEYGAPDWQQREANASGSAGGQEESVDVRPIVVTEAVAKEQDESEADASGSDGGRKVSGDVRPTVVTEAVTEGEFRQEQVKYRSLGERGWQMLNEMRQTYARITELEC